MPNVRRTAGTVPAALSATGRDIPPSPEVQERSLAELIGHAVAYRFAEMIGPVLAKIAQQQHMPACVLCVQACKQAESAHAVAVASARAAAGPEPEFAAPPISAAVTWMPLGVPGQPPSVLPVCYGHFDAGPQVRPAGLVTPDGRPVVARA